MWVLGGNPTQVVLQERRVSKPRPPSPACKWALKTNHHPGSHTVGAGVVDTWSLNSEYSYIIPPAQNLQPKSDQVKPLDLWRSRSSVFPPPQRRLSFTLLEPLSPGRFLLSSPLPDVQEGRSSFWRALGRAPPLQTASGPGAFARHTGAHSELPGCPPGFPSEVYRVVGFQEKPPRCSVGGLPFQEASSCLL